MRDVSFETMGTTARVVSDPGTAVHAQAFLAEVDARLSRFRPDSDLSRLNADPRPTVPAGRLLRSAVSAALRAARLSGGLVDPTLAAALRECGYARSRARLPAAPLAAALAAAPARRRARPAPDARWRAVAVDEAAGVVRRPPGVELDLGGTAKGWAADALAEQLAGECRFAVDCGGDMRVADATGGSWPIEVRHPLSGECAHTLHVSAGGVATSGIDARIWRRGDGSYAHHLLDPATREPAWTGLVSVTALGPTALAAEALAKAALLSGEPAARRLLGARGGVLVHEGGDVEVLGRARRRACVRIPATRLRARRAA